MLTKFLRSSRSHIFVSAFSLIELSVVLVIMSLMFVAIVSASKLEVFMQNRAIIQEFSKIEMAVNNFTNAYNFMPGEFPKASTYFGTASSADGNGNGIYDTNASAEEEISNAALHLSSSKILTSFEQEGDDSFRSEIIKIGTYKFVEHCTSISGGLFNDSGHTFSATLLNPNGAATWTPVVSSYNAYSIDHKFDDGAAQTGKMIGFVLDTDNPTYNCLTADAEICVADPDSADYVKTNKNIGCALSLGLNAILQK